MNQRVWSAPVLTVVTLAVAAPTARGGAIEIPMQSARAAGQADAFTAQADDPSAIFYNPAGLGQLTGTNVTGGIFYLQPEFHFQGPGGATEGMYQPSYLPHLYAESDFGLQHLRFGLGLNDTFGINENWGNTGPLRTLVDKGQLSVIDLAPTVAYEVDPRLSFGLAVNVNYGDLLLTRQVTLGAPPTPEGAFRFRGEAVAVSVTPGVLWKVDDRNTVGAYYRSPYSLDLSGRASLRVPGVTQYGPSHADASLDLPQSAGLGYAVRPVKQLKVEADVIWTDWHSVRQLEVASADPHFNGQTIPAHWDSGFTFRGGAQYDVTDRVAVRAGYAYGQNSVPSSTFSPLVPDANYHLFAVGVGYDTPTWGVDLAGEYILREHRDVSGSVNAPADGSWSNQIFGLMLSVNVKL